MPYPNQKPDQDEQARGLSDRQLFVTLFGTGRQLSRGPKNSASIRKLKIKFDPETASVYPEVVSKELLAEAFNALNDADKIIQARLLEKKSGVPGIVAYVQNELIDPGDIDIDVILNPGPEVAPELYENRPSGESAPEFIERVYGEAGYLTGFFGKPHLGSLDSKCVVGLKNWESAHGKARINLPDQSELNDLLLAPKIFELLPKHQQFRLTKVLKTREARAEPPPPPQ